jgi:predicted kinase
MRTIFLLCGLPACGKSTFAKELLKKEPGRWKRVNRDDLRAMMDDNSWSKTNEAFVVSVQNKIVRDALAEGFDVILDNTHLVPATVNKIHKLAESVGDVKVIKRAFNVSVEECLKRNALRIGYAKVPDKVINDMARASGISKGRKIEDHEVYYPPRDGFQVTGQDKSKAKAIVADVDGTIAIIGDRSPYDASEADIKDKPNWPVIECVIAMYEQGVEVIFMSGREDQYREQTERFINQWINVDYFNPHANPKTLVEPLPHKLYMRSTGDTRKDCIIKQELFEEHVAGKYNVLFILDDRNQTCDQWRSMGLTCFQVAPGAF